MGLDMRYDKRGVRMADAGAVVMALRGVVARAAVHGKTDGMRRMGPVGLHEGEAVCVYKGGEQEV